MWWGGFSEKNSSGKCVRKIGLNPHVVGRFFRGRSLLYGQNVQTVLIPMWWGGFSETS